MKDIKFRAWDDVLLKYYQPMTIKELAMSDMRETNWYQLTIEQYTGLKDKNNIDIYEGDKVIIKSDEEEVYTIEWCEDSARFIMSGESVVVDFDNYFGCQVEVIGNIHEWSEDDDK